MRPLKAEKPGPGQESVWDYPRPPRLEASHARVVIEFGGVRIVDTTRSLRILETSHPPVHYVPLDAVADGVLERTERESYCEWKGTALYYDVVSPKRREPAAAWGYPAPVPAYAALTGYVAFYPTRMDACSLDGERVVAQDGDFYGGWRTSRVVGPFKGGPGTWGW